VSWPIAGINSKRPCGCYRRWLPAESAFDKLIEDNRRTSLRWWQGIAGLELLLEEARHVVRSNPKTGSVWA